MKLIQSNKKPRKKADTVLYRCGRCGSTITQTVKVGGYTDQNGKRSGHTTMDVCAICLAEGRLEI